MTLGQARAWLRTQVDDGVDCPCCTQFAKVYRRKIHSAMARDLIIACRKAGTDWFHLRTVVGHQGGDFAKLAYWGLIEEMPGERDDGSSRAGWWRVLPYGVEFASNRVRVPKYAHIYDHRLLRLDDSQTVSIVDALGDKFDYRELMDT